MRDSPDVTAPGPVTPAQSQPVCLPDVTDLAAACREQRRRDPVTLRLVSSSRFFGGVVEVHEVSLVAGWQSRRVAESKRRTVSIRLLRRLVDPATL